MLEEYRECVRICAAIDYADRSSVNKSNKAVDRMYQIVQEANNRGPEAVSELASLLSDPDSAKWLAHQLVEKGIVEKELKNRCFAVVEELAKGEGVNAIGERMWLKEYRDRECR